MAATKKKRGSAIDEDMKALEVNEDDEISDLDEEDEEDEEEIEDDELLNEEVQVDFEARNPEDCDFHGIRKLLQQLFLKANVDLSELSDTIISQNYVGSIIRQADIPEDVDEDEDETDDIFGVVTALNITERKNVDWVKQLKSLLLDKCHQCAQKQRQRLEAILSDDDSHVGFVLSERFINIPAQIALPSFESLWKEVDRAKKKNMKYSFKNYLLISKTYKIPETKGKKKKGKKHQRAAGPEQMVFVNTEEETFFQESILNFSYSVAGERDTIVEGEWDDEEEAYEPFRTVMIVPSDRIPGIMATLGEDLALPGT